MGIKSFRPSHSLFDEKGWYLDGVSAAPQVINLNSNEVDNTNSNDNLFPVGGLREVVESSKVETVLWLDRPQYFG